MIQHLVEARVAAICFCSFYLFTFYVSQITVEEVWSSLCSVAALH